MDNNTLRQRLEGKKCIILGSSPTPHISSDMFDKDTVLICIKGSGWGAQRLGLPDPFITFELDWNYLRFLQSNVLRGLKSEIVIHILQREITHIKGLGKGLDIENSIFFETDGEVLYNYRVGGFEMNYFRRLSFAEMMNMFLGTLKWNKYRWNDIEMILQKEDDPIEMDLFMEWMCFSTAILATSFCLTYGAKEMILSGISFTTTGHSFFTEEKEQKEDADSWPRCHVPADRMALRRWRKLGKPVKTTEPDVAQQTGIELVKAPLGDFR